MRRIAVTAMLALVLTGCVARAAYNVVTLPVRAGSKAVDWSTTSQSEADRNRGRRDRKAEERAERDAKQAAKAQAKAAREAQREAERARRG